MDNEFRRRIDITKRFLTPGLQMNAKDTLSAEVSPPNPG